MYVYTMIHIYVWVFLRHPVIKVCISSCITFSSVALVVNRQASELTGSGTLLFSSIQCVDDSETQLRCYNKYPQFMKVPENYPMNVKILV